MCVCVYVYTRMNWSIHELKSSYDDVMPNAVDFLTNGIQTMQH